MRRTYALSALLAVLSACNLGSGTDDASSGVFIFGRVDSEAGVGVPGVQMRIGYSPTDSCGTTVILGVNGPTTDSTGGYGIPIIDGGAPRRVCMKVVATPPASLPFGPDSILRTVSLTEILYADSVRIDFVLPPR
jgi:hypothetical protein